MLLDDILPPDYNRYSAPPGLKPGEPLYIEVSMFLNSLGSPSSKTMTLRLQVTLRLRWMDLRLLHRNRSHYPIIISGKLTDRLWQPLLYIPDGMETRLMDVTEINSFMAIHATKKVIFRIRFSSTISCYLNLVNYPFDSQHCTLKLQTWLNTGKEIELIWRGVLIREGSIRYDVFPVEVPRITRRIDFIIRGIGIENNTWEQEITGNYSTLMVYFFFSRVVTTFLFTTFLPSILLVASSWIPLWTRIEAVDARVLIGVTTIFSMVSYMSLTVTDTLTVGYMKSIDVWNAANLIFVILAFLEFPFVYELKKREIERSWRSRLFQAPGLPCRQVLSEETYPRSERIDRIYRIMLPTFYVIFNVGYWFTYVSRSRVEYEKLLSNQSYFKLIH